MENRDQKYNIQSKRLYKTCSVRTQSRNQVKEKMWQSQEQNKNQKHKENFGSAQSQFNTEILNCTIFSYRNITTNKIHNVFRAYVAGILAFIITN